jgi:segregation and condensation protein A
MEPQGYQVHTEYFEGPLDLLLHLIRKNKMNIMDIRISEITSEYLYYLENERGINPSREGDFLMTAATLIYIKSRSLLPRPDTMDEDSPEAELLHSLIEYDKIQKISKLLQELEQNELLLWRREAISEHFDHKEFEIQEVSTFQLAEVFLNLVKKQEREKFLYIESKEYSIGEKQDELLKILGEEGFLNFSEYLERLDSIEEILVSFFALLELVKQRVIIAIQKRLFDSISVWQNTKDYDVKDVRSR